ncbi:hypothetical protein ACNJQJ_21005, partial [Mycobacterium tuberculosis]
MDVHEQRVIIGHRSLTAALRAADHTVLRIVRRAPANVATAANPLVFGGVVHPVGQTTTIFDVR